MTDKELKDEYATLCKSGGGNRFEGNYTEEQKRRWRELDCIEMINSLLAYDYAGESSAQHILSSQKDKYLKRYVADLGETCVLSLIEGQINDIKDISRDVFTDSEGVTYNSIVWAK